MALIKCTECGKEFSDKAESCPNCGCPTEYVIKAINEKKKKLKTCPFCGSVSIDEDGYCNECGYKIPKVDIETQCPKCGEWIKDSEGKCKYCGYEFEKPSPTPTEQISYEYEEPKKQFNGVYRYSLFGKKSEVYCPRCGSEDCSIQREEKVIPGKTKTSYTANLNPFKPFTFANKKEKVVRKERTISNNVFVCNKCGKTFY